MTNDAVEKTASPRESDKADDSKLVALQVTPTVY